MLRVARSTLSRYCRFFKDYLSEKPQTGRHQRKYTEEDIAVLREISLLTHKVNFADIPKFLTVKKPKDIETEEIGYDIQELLWIVNHEFKAQEETNKKLLFKYDLLVKHLEQTRYLINSSAFIREVSIEKKEIEERITSLESQKRSFISISL
jgi:DNA-binding transcriptional MerR regulator